MTTISKYDAFVAATAAIEAGEYDLAQRMLDVVSKAILLERERGELALNLTLSTDEDEAPFKVLCAMQ